MLRRVAVLLAVVGFACSDSTQTPDAATHKDAPDVDAAVDAMGSGSGSDAFASLDAHPHDRNLELLVAGLGLVAVVGPVGNSRRRRKS